MFGHKMLRYNRAFTYAVGIDFKNVKDIKFVTNSDQKMAKLFNTITYMCLNIDQKCNYDGEKVERTGVLEVYNMNLSGIEYCFSNMKKGRDFEVKKIFLDNNGDIRLDIDDFYMILDPECVNFRPDIFSPFHQALINATTQTLVQS
jgi:hypothetical protein